MSVEAEQTQEKSGVKDTVRVVIHALILALLVRVFLFQPFNIPSGSMIPTLLVGDYLFVSKYSYGYSRYSFPFGPNLFSGRIWSKEPERGDVVVFKLPRDNDDRLHQARDRSARRRDPDGPRRAAHQRRGGEEGARQRFRHARPFRPRAAYDPLHGDLAERRDLSRARPRR